MKLTETMQKKLAMLIGVSEEEVRSDSSYLDALDAVYLANPIRGGASVIMKSENDFLYAISAVSYTQLISDFQKGIRSDPSEWDNAEIL